MDALRKARRPVRAQVTRLADEISNMCLGDQVDLEMVQIKLKLLDNSNTMLTVHDEKIMDRLMIDDVTDQESDTEYKTIEDYQIKTEKARLIASKKLFPTTNVTPSVHSQDQGDCLHKKRTYTLPKIEIKKFTGDLKEWLGFWAQFAKIHNDEDLTKADKFQYLIQSMAKGSRALEVIDSYPQSAENYENAVNALQRRFGRDHLLVEVYVRELIKMVIHITNEKGKVALTNLFDKLESHLRALESLGVTSDKCAAILFPLVESCLPEDTLKAWHRSPLSKKEEDPLDTKTGRLYYLMEFLREEVEAEERIILARQGFSLSKPEKKVTEIKLDVPTAHELVSTEIQDSTKKKCIFCGLSHESAMCVKAISLSADEKQEKIKQSKACFVCLNPGHRYKECKGVVKCIICSKKHHTIMCQRRDGEKTFDKPKENEDKPESGSTSHGMASLSGSGEVLLKTIMVKIVHEDKTKTVRVVLDTGSQRTYIKRSLADEMRYIPKSQEEITHVLFGGRTMEPVRHNNYEIQLQSLDNKNNCMVLAMDNEQICGRIPRLQKGPWFKELSEKKIWINDCGRDIPEIAILIGSDRLPDLLTGKMCKLRCGLLAQETIFGWTVMGKYPHHSDHLEYTSAIVTSMTVTTPQISDMWNLDILGISDPIAAQTRKEREKLCDEQFRESIRLDEEGRYQVSLPWISENHKLPTNKYIAERRLLSATNRLKEMSRMADYQNVFDKWLHEGIIEIVPEDDTNGNVHYLPHRPVFKDSKTTPVRPVYDASCKLKNGISLNDCLDKGKNLLERIPALILRFRLHEVGVTSDVKTAFLTISVAPKDRDFLRFLWWDKIDPRKIIIFRHKRLPFGLVSSPYLLAATIEYHLDSAPEGLMAIAQLLKKSMYVDNCVYSTEASALTEFIEGAVKIMKTANKDLRLWESTGKIDDNVEPITNVLGLRWDKINDELFCESPPMTIQESFTKRVILSAAHKIFDPMGFLSPVTLGPKLLLKEVCRMKVGMDEELPNETKLKHLKWIKDLKGICEVRIPRWMSEGKVDIESMQLHVFCDASKYAYATVIYVRCQHNGYVTVQLLQSKTRVSPETATIPRLELLACFIGSRLADSVKQALGWEHMKTFYWSDSTTALAWINREVNWGTFVGNRVKEILRLTTKTDWHHVPGLLNPADIPSRGCSAKKLLELRWWEGPNWLKDDPCTWLSCTLSYDEEAINLEKLKSVKVNVNVAPSRPWYMERTNSYMKIIRTIAWSTKRVIRKKRLQLSPTCVKKLNDVPELTVDEIENAEKTVVQLVQLEMFNSMKISGDIRVERGKDGLLRVKTKIIRRNDSYEFTHPLLLPSRHLLVTSLIQYVHIKNCHAGIQTMMTLLRERFWILISRKTIRRIISKCVSCQRFIKKGLEAETAPLPLERVQAHDVFEITGVDLCGPVYLNGGSKAWIVLFTCAYFRAVHLELVSSLSTYRFLQSLQRFICLRGRPRVIWSDNGTNFTGADNAMRGLDWRTIEKESTCERIQWKFNPPAAPFWGGWWERLIGMTKQLLVRVLGKSKLNYEDMMTVLGRIAATINTRPLTYVSEESNEMIPLTPAHFLQGIRNNDMRDLDIIENLNLGHEHRHRQRIKEALQMRFRNEYLSQLVQRGKEIGTRPVGVGDVVLVGHEGRKRILWPMGKVIEVYPGSYGAVRVAKIKTSGGILTRPVQKFYRLEMIQKKRQLSKTTLKVIRMTER